MSGKQSTANEPIQIAIGGTALGTDGDENSVYLGTDGFVYHVTARQSRGGIKTAIASKRQVGDYLRWVDGLFRPGELPSEVNGVHYRAARKLRELI